MEIGCSKAEVWVWPWLSLKEVACTSHVPCRTIKDESASCRWSGGREGKHGLGWITAICFGLSGALTGLGGGFGGSGRPIRSLACIRVVEGTMLVGPSTGGPVKDPSLHFWEEVDLLSDWLTQDIGEKLGEKRSQLLLCLRAGPFKLWAPFFKGSDTWVGEPRDCQYRPCGFDFGSTSCWLYGLEQVT